MKVQSVRFGPSQWRLVRSQARDEGVSASQFIRDAAFARAMVQWAGRADDNKLDALFEIITNPRQREILERFFEQLLPELRADDPERVEEDVVRLLREAHAAAAAGDFDAAMELSAAAQEECAALINSAPARD